MTATDDRSTPEAHGSVIVVGSVNVDLVVVAAHLPAAGETVVGGDMAQYGGGKGANAAVAAARAGGRVCFVGAVGDDDLGRWSAAQLSGEAIDLTDLQRLGSPTGVALIVVDAAGENQIAVGPGANAALDADDVRAAVARLATGARCLLMSAEVGADCLAAAIDEAVRAGVRCVLNPAPMSPALAPLAAQVDVLTPNETELADLADALGVPPGSRLDRAVAVASRTGADLIVTCGGEGALVVARDRPAYLVPSIDVDVVDTTGAGDTLNGVLAAGLAAHGDVHAAARAAVAAAGVSVTVVGARGGMPNAAAIAAALTGG